MTSTVKKDGSTLIFGTLDQILHSFLALRADQRTKIGTLFETSIDGQVLSTFCEFRKPLLALTDHDESAESHTSLTGGTESSTSDSVESVILVAVRQYGGVILSTKICLDTLAIGGSTSVDILAGTVGADKTDSFNGRLIDDIVDGFGSTVDNVDNAIWETGLLAQFCENHSCTGIPFTGLEDQSVASNSSQGDTPEGNHGREVEGANSCNDTKRLAVRSCLHIFCDLNDLANKLSSDATSSFTDLKTTEDVSLCISKCFALLKGN